MNIKKILILMILPLAILGCGVKGVVDNYVKNNPDAKPYVIDNDGDGIGDSVGLLDENGNPKLDDEGNPVEIEGGREQFDNAKAADNSLATTLLLLSGVIPGAGYIGKLWGRLKPTARANALAVQLKTVVKSVDAVRQLEFSDPAILPAIDQTLRNVQQTATGVEAAVAAVKAEIIAENEAQAKAAA